MAYYLAFRDKLFTEIAQSDIKESDLAILLVDGSQSTLYFNASINIIDKLTAQRQANSIAKTGFLLSNNMRIGSKTNLKITLGELPVNSTSEQPSTAQSIPSKVKQLPSVPEEVPQEHQTQEEVSNEKVVYERPIEFTVSRDHSEIEENLEGSENVSVPEFKLNELRTDRLSIQDVFKEEQMKVLEDEQQTQEETSVRSYDEVIEYFWKELFGQVYTSWDTLPSKAKEDFFQTLDINELSDQEVQELFALRHENNIEAFKKKLEEITNRNRID